MADLRLPHINDVALAGRLTRDPVIRAVADGKTVAEFGIAVDWWTGTEKKTDFFQIQAWNKAAVYIQEHLHKGTAVYVQGRLHNDEWLDREGKKQHKTRVVARSVQALQWPEDKPEPSEIEDDVPF